MDSQFFQKPYLFAFELTLSAVENVEAVRPLLFGFAVFEIKFEGLVPVGGRCSVVHLKFGDCLIPFFRDPAFADRYRGPVVSRKHNDGLIPESSRLSDIAVFVLYVE